MRRTFPLRRITRGFLQRRGKGTIFVLSGGAVRGAAQVGMLRAALEEEGKGRVLVVAGKGSIRCALVGGNLGSLASENGWGGIVIDGCVRDVEELSTCRIGIFARGTCPRRSEKQGKGSRDISVRISDVTISPGMQIWADADGVVVADQDISS